VASAVRQSRSYQVAPATVEGGPGAVAHEGSAFMSTQEPNPATDKLAVTAVLTRAKGER
jgi:hypothetical protein